jgi:hypothetical protein
MKKVFVFFALLCLVFGLGFASDTAKFLNPKAWVYLPMSR